MATVHVQPAQWPIHLIHHDPRVRQMRPGEVLDPDLIQGFERLPLDHEWVWVAEDRTGQPEAVLIASPVHGVAALHRLYAKPDSSKFVVGRLLRQALKDMYNRGFVGYMVTLDPDRPIEAQLMKIVARWGGQLFGKGLIFAGLTNCEQIKLEQGA